MEGEPTEEVETVHLPIITPQISDPKKPKPDRKPVRPIEAGAPPPILESIRTTKVEVFIPGAESFGKAPTRVLPMGDIKIGLQVPEYSKEIHPISPPSVTYPSSMVEKGIEGFCEVHFDVNFQGEAFNIDPHCSHSGFEKSAKKAVAKSRFSPRVEAGQPVIQKNVVYPIEFKLPTDT